MIPALRDLFLFTYMHCGSFNERLISPQFYEVCLHLAFKQQGKQNTWGVRKYPRSTVQLLRCATSSLGNVGLSNSPVITVWNNSAFQCEDMARTGIVT